MNHVVVFNTLIPKYLFNKNEHPKIIPVNRKMRTVPIIAYRQSLYDSFFIFRACINSFILLLPSRLTIITEYKKSGTNRKYPVKNQYNEGLSKKLDFKKGNSVNNSKKKYTVATPKIVVALKNVIFCLYFIPYYLYYKDIRGFHLTRLYLHCGYNSVVLWIAPDKFY